MQRRYVYPKICVIESAAKINPFRHDIAKEVRLWTQHFKLSVKTEDMKKIDGIVNYICLAYPSGDFKRSLLVTKFIVHALLLDDVIEMGVEEKFFVSIVSDKRSIMESTKIFDTAAKNDTPFATSFADIWEQLKQVANETWVTRFSGNYLTYLKAAVWELENNRSNRVPPLLEFLEYRPYASGVFAMFNLIELSRDIFIEDSILVNHTIQRLTHIACSYYFFVNEIYSFEKERRDGQLNNLVTVVKHSYNTSYQEAIEKVAMMANDEIERFFMLEPFVMSFGVENDKQIKLYLEGLCDWMKAVHEWCSSSDRYKRYSYSEEDF